PVLAATVFAEPALSRPADAAGDVSVPPIPPRGSSPAETEETGAALPERTAGAAPYALLFPHSPHHAPPRPLAADSSAEARRFLDHTADWPHRRLALWGPAGCGKTRLLHSWVRRQGAVLVAGPGLRLVPPERPLAIDDADAAPEAPLLHTLNA